MMLCNALTESASAEISFYVHRSDWWAPENDATRGSDLNGSRNYHSGTNKKAARQIRHGRRPTGTVVGRSEQTAPTGFILTTFSCLEICYGYNKSSLSLSRPPICPHFHAFVPMMKVLFCDSVCLTLLTGRPCHKTTHSRKCSQELWANVSLFVFLSHLLKSANSGLSTITLAKSTKTFMWSGSEWLLSCSIV